MHDKNKNFTSTARTHFMRPLAERYIFRRAFMKIMISATLTVFSLWATSSYSVITATDGIELLGACLAGEGRSVQAMSESEKISYAYCLGMIQGVSNTMRFVGDDSIIKNCLPKSGIKNDQAARITTKYLREHPEDLHRGAPTLVAVALREAFPCKNT